MLICYGGILSINRVGKGVLLFSEWEARGQIFINELVPRWCFPFYYCNCDRSSEAVWLLGVESI